MNWHALGYHRAVLGYAGVALEYTGVALEGIEMHRM